MHENRIADFILVKNFSKEQTDKALIGVSKRSTDGNCAVTGRLYMSQTYYMYVFVSNNDKKTT